MAQAKAAVFMVVQAKAAAFMVAQAKTVVFMVGRVKAADFMVVRATTTDSKVDFSIHSGHTTRKYNDEEPPKCDYRGFYIFVRYLTKDTNSIERCTDEKTLHTEITANLA